MKSKLALFALVASAMLAPALSHAAPDGDKDRTSPKAFVKDSAITTKIKAKLATEKISSLAMRKKVMLASRYKRSGWT